MGLSRVDWTPPFSTIPRWRCPTCKTGHLTHDRKKVSVEVVPESLVYHPKDEVADWSEKHFTTLLRCASGLCKQIVAISGYISVEENVWARDADETELLGPDYYEAYNPTSIFPAPHIFLIPIGTPSSVIEEMRRAFRLYWIDNGSCANRLRAAAESVLTDRKISRFTTSKSGKRQRIPLHGRIELLREKDPVSANYLLAVKWFGNEGSHTGLNAITRDNLLNVFELMEAVLVRLYEKPAARLDKLANAINTRKGRVRENRRTPPF